MPGTRPPEAKRRRWREQSGQRWSHIFYRSAFQAMVNSFTNWERNQWAAAGYPGLSSEDIDALRLHCVREVATVRREICGFANQDKAAGDASRRAQ